MFKRLLYSVTTRQCRRRCSLERVGLLLVVAFVCILGLLGILRMPDDVPGAARPSLRARLGGRMAAAARADEAAEAAEEAEAAAERSGDPSALAAAEQRASEAASVARAAEQAAVAAAEAAVAPTTTTKKPLSHKPLKVIKELIKLYSFQPVRTERGELVNVVLVRAPFRAPRERELFEKHKHEILFLGICSFEDFPLPPQNPFSGSFPKKEYVGMFPGWLHMFRKPEEIYPPHVKLLLMSQSDFSLPEQGRTMPKKYDFVYSGSDQDVHNDCVGWASFAKNWTFVKESLKVMCGELGMTGVLVATKDKQNKKACTIPPECQGKMVQTPFLDQGAFFDYARQSHFAFFPQIHDASPRVTTQALSLNLPLLMNWHISGGWKYVIEGETGEFFHDMSDFRQAVQRIRSNIAANKYHPRRLIDESYGDNKQGPRLKEWVAENFAHHVKLPPGTQMLLPTGA